MALEYSVTPVGQRRSAARRNDARDEAASHVCHLADAVDADSQLLFDDYIKWVNVRLRQDYRRSEGLDHQLACMASVLRQRMPPRVAAAAVQRLEKARALLPSMPAAAPTAIDPEDRLAPLAREYVRKLLGGFRQEAADMILDATRTVRPSKKFTSVRYSPRYTRWGACGR